MAFTDASGQFIPAMPRGLPKPNKLHLAPATTYFFKKSDGSFIATDEKTAWRIYSGKNQTIGRQPEPWEYVGRTNGKHYVKCVNEAFAVMAEHGEEAYKEALEKALKEEYKLAKKDKIPPPDQDIINTSGLSNNDILRP